MTIVLRLTRSQQMALIDILIAYSMSDDAQLFVDVSTDMETTVGELLKLVSSFTEVELDQDHEAEKARVDA